MKTRILSLLLVLITVVGVLASCGGGGGTPCTKHVDKNSDGKCDTCSTAFTCVHKDNDHNQKCDDCQAAVECQHELDEDGFCQYCPYAECVRHVDRDHNLVCDNDGCGAAVACVNHADRDENNKCDWCSTAFSCPLLAQGAHQDRDQNSECDGCFFIMETFDFPWTNATLTFEMTDNSNGQELPSGCRNWMAGESTGTASMTQQAAAERNDEALEKTKIAVEYSYLPDNDNRYEWGANYNRIQQNQGKGLYSDMYCNFVYDLMGASLLGCFHNLKTTQHGTNYFEFAGKADYGTTVGDSTGYMYEYMTSLSIDEKKMYLVASDYFIDLIRAYFCVPVNVAMLEDLAADDVLGLGRDNTITDFTNAVSKGKWTYDLVMKYSAKFGDANVASQKKGFAVATHSLSGAGLLYTTDVKLFTDARKEAGNNFEVTGDNSPYTYTDTNEKLYTFAANLQALVESSGVVIFRDHETSGADNNLLGIRSQFSKHQVLFGGVILLGSLEYKDYQDMKAEGGKGFLVVPVPLYDDYAVYNEQTGEVKGYSTQIHNVGRIGAISVKTNKFSECSAFLDFQSTHSRAVRDTYYDFDLVHSVVGGADEEILNANIEMLTLLRASVVTGFDMAYEDASAMFNTKETVSTIDGEKPFNALKWHDILEQGDYKRASAIRTYYNQLKPAKEKCMKKLFSSAYTMLPV